VNTRVHSKLHKTTTTPTLRLARALSVPLSPFSPNVSCPPALSQAADSGLGAPAPPLMTVHAPPPREEKCCDARVAPRPGVVQVHGSKEKCCGTARTQVAATPRARSSSWSQTQRGVDCGTEVFPLHQPQHVVSSRATQIIFPQRTVGIPYICKAEGQCMELICPPDWLAKAKMRSSRYCGGRHPSPQDQSFPLQRALRQGLASA